MVQQRDAVNKSPFFAPQPPRSHLVTTPGGSINRVKDVDETPKSSVAGATFNLINTIVGAGIVGIPFAIDQCSLVLGIFMVIVFAVLTIKSLRLLIETAKHVDVSSYERLMEVSFGKAGFNFIAIAMFIMSYGALVGYMIIVKSNLSMLLGVDSSDVQMTRAVLTLSSLSVMLPLALQRDVSNLSKTSAISVVFDCILVVIVGVYSPVRENVQENGGIRAVMKNSKPDMSTFFVGIGVLCFAFVCQHSAFIIAASLDKPTRERWNMVTSGALTVCAVLASIMGAAGFLGFFGETDGDILVNLGEAALSGDYGMQRAANIVRGLLCTTMFFVWPVELFVARHVCVVMFFKGRRAHEGDDHSVLARRDRRVAVTVVIYLLALFPALLFDDLGSVFSVTGSLGGAALSYVGPGLTYLGVHGGDFMNLVSKRWSSYVPSTESTQNDHGLHRNTFSMFGNLEGEGRDNNSSEEENTVEKNIIVRIIDWILWYILLMPLWCRIAVVGNEMLKMHREAEALKSPMPYALGKIIHHSKSQSQYRNLIRPQQQGQMMMMHGRKNDFDDGEDMEDAIPNERKPLIRNLSFQDMKSRAFLSTTTTTKAAIAPLPPGPSRSRSSRARVGFSLSVDHGPLNEKPTLDRSRPITPKSFSAASFEVARSNSYGSTRSGMSVQEEARQIINQTATAAATTTKPSTAPSSITTSDKDKKKHSHRRQISDLSGISVDGDISHCDNSSHMSSVFISDHDEDTDNDISQGDEEESQVDDTNHDSDTSSVHVPVPPRPMPNKSNNSLTTGAGTGTTATGSASSTIFHDDSIPKVVKAPALDKIKVAPAVVKRMYERGNVVSVAVRTGKDDDVEDDPQDDDPTVMDFFIAIFYIIFGFVAASAGLFSSLG